MINTVQNIINLRTPGKIFRTIIQRIAVQVTYDLTRFSDAIKCFTDNSVQQKTLPGTISFIEDYSSVTDVSIYGGGQ